MALNLKGKLVHDNEKNYPVYLVFFIGVALTGLGSSYYHGSPDNSTLLWDRLPMTVIFVTFFVAIVSEHMNPCIGQCLLYPLLGIGLFSVVYWYLTELQGRGDLRLYGLIQFLPFLMVLLICVICHSRFTRGQDIYVTLGSYGLAKLFEYFDKAVFSLTGIIGGHTMKHLFAAFGTFWFLRMLRLRGKNP
jgi:hypothetical protein